MTSNSEEPGYGQKMYNPGSGEDRSPGIRDIPSP